MELPDLYRVVPAAEEEDLFEQVQRERDAEEVPDDDAPVEEEAPLRPGQVLGLLEHRLGAQVVRRDGPDTGGL